LVYLGDERPCQRCIKRGLAEQCQDGVRKKAKYLHDAPPEALIPPPLGGAYGLNGNKSSTPTIPISGSSIPQTTSYFPTTQNTNLDMFPQTPTQIQIAHGLPSAASSFGAQTPISPSFTTGAQQGNQLSVSQSIQQQPYAFDPSDPALFNLDIGSFNFVNQYGALEFGMLNQMTSNINDGTQDVMTPINQVQTQYVPQFQTQDSSLLFPQDAMMNVDFSPNRQATASARSLRTPHNTPIISTADRNDITNGPYAYAIAARPNSLASASPDPVDMTGVGESASSPALFASDPGYARRQSQHQPVQPPQKSLAMDSAASSSKKRPRSADYIYDSVKKPYSYTEGFHRLLNYLKKNYRKDNMARIAQAIARVRPALITFAQRLSEQDLIFMEIGVQRTLFEYNDFISSTGTPTVVIRRDGTILAVSEEFCIITGWTKAVLLGKHPNRNINRGPGASSIGNIGLSKLSDVESTNSSSNGLANHIQLSGSTTSFGGTVPSSLFVAEIMDQESVVQFYEDYAKLAFANPMGRGMRRGKLLKYRTPEDVMRSQGGPGSGSRAGSRRNSRTGEDVKPMLGDKEEGIATEWALRHLGEPEGVVDCMYSWWVRRDNFEVPQLIVMNVSSFSLLLYADIIADDWISSYPFYLSIMLLHLSMVTKYFHFNTPFFDHLAMIFFFRPKGLVG
jgi:PAS domain-containing protein